MDDAAVGLCITHNFRLSDVVCAAAAAAAAAYLYGTCCARWHVQLSGALQPTCCAGSCNMISAVDVCSAAGRIE